MTTYPKIYPPFKRSSDNSLDHGIFFSPEIETLADKRWSWTEKIDGTNIRVMWDGHNVTFGGRTDNAQLPANYLEFLRTSFSEELLEYVLRDQPTVLFGEGVGPGLAKGSGKYSVDYDLVLFDIYIHPYWLRRLSVEDIATKLGMPTVPYLGDFDLKTAIVAVEDGLQSRYGRFVAEGLVGTAPLGLLSRGGDRIQVKVKTKDFPE